MNDVPDIPLASKKKRIYPLKIQTIPLQNEKISNNIQPLNRIIREGAEHIEEPHTSVPDDYVKRERPIRNREEGNDEDFRFKRHKNKTGIPSLGERLDTLQNKLPPKRMENFDSSFPPQPSSQHNFTNNKHIEIENDSETNKESPSSISTTSSNVTSTDNNNINRNATLNNPPQLMPNQQYPNQMYPMYYIPIPTSPIHPQYYQSNHNNNNEDDDDNESDTNNNNHSDKPTSMIANPSIPPYFQYPPSSQPFVSPYPQFIPQLAPPNGFNPMYQNMNNANSTSNNKNRSSRRKHSLAGNRGRRLSITSSRENSVVLPHSDIPMEEYYRHLPDSNVSDKLKQLFTWCAVKTSQNLNQRESRKMHNNQDNVNDDPVISTYLNSKKFTLDIINDFVNDLQKGNLDIDWNIPSDKLYNNVNEDKKPDIDVKPNVSSLDEDPIMKELFDDVEDNETEPILNHSAQVTPNGNKDNDDGNVTYYYDGLNMKRFKKPNKTKSLMKNLPKKKLQSRSINNLLPNPKNVENERNLKSLNERITKLKSEIDSWKDVITGCKPNSEWKSLQELIDSKNSSQTEMEPEMTDKVNKLYDDLFKISLELSDRINKFHSYSHFYHSHTSYLAQSVSHKIAVLSTEFYHRHGLNQKKPNSRNLLWKLGHYGKKK